MDIQNKTTSRIMEIVQYEFNPETGEDLHFNETNIIKGLNHKSIKEWAYILHDKDKRTQEEFDAYVSKNDKKPKWKVGDDKPKHWHIELKFDRTTKLSVVADWFGVPINQIEKKIGQNAFLDSVEYITHERKEQQAKGKFLYPDIEVKASFNFREALTEYQFKRINVKKKDKTVVDEWIVDILKNGKLLRECEKENSALYIRNIHLLERARQEYIFSRPLPTFRINYYIDGVGGIGKSTASLILAKQLGKQFFPDFEEKELIYYAGGKGVAFQEYDGQPIIVWEDRRAMDFLSEWDRGLLFNMWNYNPKEVSVHRKYGDVRLLNAINIINGIQPYKEFLDNLAGEYTDKNGKFNKAEDKSQSQRRFPIILNLREEDFDILINKGVANGTREYDQYNAYKNFVGNFGNVHKKLSGNAREVVEVDMSKPVIEKSQEVRNSIEGQKIENIEEIPEEFKNYGKQKDVEVQTISISENKEINEVPKQLFNIDNHIVDENGNELIYKNKS